jgi:hypothetical protein
MPDIGHSLGESWLDIATPMIGDWSRRGREEDSNMVKFHMATAKDKKAEHHYFRVIVTYSDGETSGNRVFKDREKAEESALGRRSHPS